MKKMICWMGGLLLLLLSATSLAGPTCPNTVKADVVALDQAMMINRLGAFRPNGMIYALKHDVVAIREHEKPGPGNAKLRKGKRPRPLVLRVNAGDCLVIHFENWLQPGTIPPPVGTASLPVTNEASIHVAGLEPVKSITDDGTFVGNSPAGPKGQYSGIIAPGKSITYTLFAPKEGSFLLYSMGSQSQLTYGLFGAVNVQPKGSEWYRSQVTQQELSGASRPGTNGYPIIDYNAVNGQTPILQMLDKSNKIVHSDLTAIITGPNHGAFPPPAKSNPAYPNPTSPYREVTVLYHESFDIVQAFPQFYETTSSSSSAAVGLANALSGANDNFSINYGSAGISAEVLANRLQVGPSANCPECKFEEFFLSSWVGGDPAMVVDNPANLPCTKKELEKGSNNIDTLPNPPCQPTGKPKATMAFFPDDPSNVYHTYQGDRARFRVLHAGQGIFHVHHHHAHQWLFSPESSNSSYLDSQTIGPGSSFTMDLVYEGSGNRNLTPGDSIFHCHFYPHFASGMWALFRVHDVLELGTPLDGHGRPMSGKRALPDGEIAAGTPIPAVVPLPTRAMAPLPAAVQIVDGQVEFIGKGNPGYPFFVPGKAGHRAPHPPLDFAVTDKGEELNGGLPRHLITGGTISINQYTPTDFTKEMSSINAISLPEKGTPIEQIAMSMHEQPSVPSFTPEGNSAPFAMNGLPRQSGAPFANPARGASGTPAVRRYKGAAMQTDVVLNKKGWHFPQQRILALWQDVKPILHGQKAPEPLFFRANSNEVVEYWHANLVPNYYELDDFEVRTPTDIIGQHIHLVKFDVLASDGAANGFNYEDGTFSPDEVRSRITGINSAGGLDGKTTLTAKAIPDFGNGPTPGSQQWLGAQATVQRWWVDPVLDNQNKDRTLLTVFTHDHFGPSTHQMVGLYAGLIVEPTGSSWTTPNGVAMGTRPDGGPTSYAANILPPDGKAYREFGLAVADSQFAYQAGSRTSFDCYPGQLPQFSGCKPNPNGTYAGWADPTNAINPKPTPALIAGFGVGMSVLNYRNESLALRLAGGKNSTDPESDPAQAFRSIHRKDAQLNHQPKPLAQINPGCTGKQCFRFPKPPISHGMKPHDPYTPMLNVYENDPVQLRLIDGALVGNHNLTVNGNKWLFEPFNPNSGYRGSQTLGLSEHFEAMFTIPQTGKVQTLDYLYAPSSAYDGLINGAWGLMRSHNHRVSHLKPLPNNPEIKPVPNPMPTLAPCGSIPAGPCTRTFNVSATTIGQLLKGQSLVYNSRGAPYNCNASGQCSFSSQPLNDPHAIVYVQDQDLNPNGTLKAGFKVEPLVLRAAAGDVIKVKLTNRIDSNATVFTMPESAYRPGVEFTKAFSNINLYPSSQVGLHPQLLAMDISHSDGMNVGNNPLQTVPAAKSGCSGSSCPSTTYTWYAGSLQNGVATPIEFGALNLRPADLLMQTYHGLFGGMIIEPLGSHWIDDPDTHISSTVFDRNNNYLFRDFALHMQTDVAMQLNKNALNAAGMPMMAVNYRSEPFFYRYGERLNNAFPQQNPPLKAPNWANLSQTDVTNIGTVNGAGPFNSNIDTVAEVSNSLVGGDPQTPVFVATAGKAVRFRLFGPQGIADNQNVFELTGHHWQFEPYRDNSRKIGNNPDSPYTGTQSGYATSSHFDVVIDSAGGVNSGLIGAPVDYLYRSWPHVQYENGLWGIFRVSPACQTCEFSDNIYIDLVEANGSSLMVEGRVTVGKNGVKWSFAETLTIVADGKELGVVKVDASGRWRFAGNAARPELLEVRSKLGGVAHYRTSTILARAQTAAEDGHANTTGNTKPARTATRRTR